MGTQVKDCCLSSSWWRRWRLAVLILATLIVTAGCNPLESLYYFIAPAPTTPPEVKLSADKKETKVVLMASHTIEPRTELFSADEEILRDLSEILKKRFEENKEKVKIVPPYQVKSYLNKLSFAEAPYDVGKHFKADFVVSLDINSLGLYKKGSFNQLYLGAADITVTATDVNLPREENPIKTKEYNTEYPKSGEIPVDGSSPAAFRSVFLNRVATDLAKYFTVSETKDDME